MKPAPYMPIPAVIERIEDETPSIKTFTLRPRDPVVTGRPYQRVREAVPIDIPR